ncbi:hypothetical protein AO242_09930 [Pseudomonas sp. ICMP 561]|nr:hypothetical protein AO242_09930 [Pseudomonas sp. ICMP 561]
MQLYPVWFRSYFLPENIQKDFSRPLDFTHCFALFEQFIAGLLFSPIEAWSGRKLSKIIQTFIWFERRGRGNNGFQD